MTNKQPGTPPWHQTDEQVKLCQITAQCFKTKQSFIFLTYVDIMIPTLKCHKKTKKICCFIFKLFHVWIMKSWNKISVKICDCDFWEFLFFFREEKSKQTNSVIEMLSTHFSWCLQTCLLTWTLWLWKKIMYSTNQ